MDRVLSVFGLGSFIRQPFWYGSLGGSWINMVGESVVGDVSIWTTMVAQNLVPSTAGRFITPYYVLNMFAVPGLIWAVYSIYTDKMEKRRIRLFFILATLVSILMGTLLPLEIALILICPLLFVFHIMYTGMLFGLFQAAKVALGFSYTGNVTVALPGNLFEFLNFARNANYSHVIYTILIVGVASFLIYFLVTRIYFKYLALDLFNSGSSRRYVDTTIEAMGGTANIKMLHASINRLTIQVFDNSNLKLSMLSELGATRIVETRAGYSIDFGSGSTMIKRGIEKQLRAVQRSA
ncbi:PTS system glucoside-specific EIICBA component [bioreactor metagenome]|uniref:PTS system glucoside-specific EIICBA component n=2 Tax=root TaxID=1 RepID=A0A645E8J0_9ZZZZ